MSGSEKTQGCELSRRRARAGWGDVLEKKGVKILPMSRKDGGEMMELR